MRRLLIAALLCTLLGAAQAATPARLCPAHRTDDTTQPIPASLATAVNRLFATHMTPEVAVATTVYRCVDGHALICTAGANLPCGKANVSRTNAGAGDWCRDNPEADFVPAYATGHDTIYQWRCHGGKPAIERQTSNVDARGFVARYWKRLD